MLTYALSLSLQLSLETLRSQHGAALRAHREELQRTRTALTHELEEKWLQRVKLVLGSFKEWKNVQSIWKAYIISAYIPNYIVRTCSNEAQIGRNSCLPLHLISRLSFFQFSCYSSAICVSLSISPPEMSAAACGQSSLRGTHRTHTWPWPSWPPSKTLS